MISKLKFVFYFFIIYLGLSLPNIVFSQISNQTSNYPKLANYFLKSPITAAEARELARFDLLIFGMQVQDTSPEVFKIIRSLNPEVKILAYLSASDFPIERYQGLESVNGPWHKFKSNLSDSWWLRDSQGTPISFWPGNWALNMSEQAPQINNQRLNTYLPDFLQKEIMATGYWDGVFLDNLFEKVAFINHGDIDINGDYQKDNQPWLEEQWFQGMSKMLKLLREKLGSDKIIIGNGGTAYYQYTNGRYFENFPTYWDDYWCGSMKQYADLMVRANKPQIVILGSSTNNTGNFKDYRWLRFGLVSALLNDGYFAFNYGDQDPSQYAWYDEYDVDLGMPINDAYNLSNSDDKNFTAGIWRRDFTKGIVLINMSNVAQRIELEENFKKIAGRQDIIINNGQTVSSVFLPHEDGLILLRLNEYKQFKFFDWLGQTIVSDNTSFNQKIPEFSNISYDLDQDGRAEKVVSSNGYITFYNSLNQVTKRIKVYPNFNGLINLASGDLNGDGTIEIVTGAGRGGGPHIKIYSSDGRLLNPGFFAYDKKFRGGVSVSVGDVNGDGKAEIVTGAGRGGGPHIRIFNAAGQPLSGFFAKDKRERQGIQFFLSDIDNDNQKDIITY